MPDTRIEDDTISIDGNEISFSEEIDEVVEIGDSIVVLLKTLGRSNAPDNVYCIDPEDGISWTIEIAPSEEPYTGLWIEDDNLWAYNWDGFGYKIDLKTGSHLERELLR